MAPRVRHPSIILNVILSKPSFKNLLQLGPCNPQIIACPPTRDRKNLTWSIRCCVQRILMCTGQNVAILSWIQEVARSMHKIPPNTEQLEEVVSNLTPTSTPVFQRKRKRLASEAENSIPHPDPPERPHRTSSEAASTISVRLPNDITSLTPSSSVASRAGRSRSSSLSRVKAELAVATPRVVCIHESTDPKNAAATQLLTSLTQVSEFSPDEHIVQRILHASCQFATEMRSEGS
ncbi:unnamed protein product [Penicillium pancosmium]